MDRYALIHTKIPREFVLLQGTGCRWRKCTFCDYHEDVSEHPFEVNEPVLRQVTGKYGVLDVINSGSAMELDEETIAFIKEVVKEKKIHTLWFEAHYMYRKKLASFAEQFAPTKVKFRCGVETFDPILRDAWKKGIPSSVSVQEIAQYFQGICLLCCTQGETKEHILKDIELAKEHFEYFSVNVFCNNHTSVKQDKDLATWFAKEVYPLIKDEPCIEVLLENTDLGVG
ncbi:MAG: hypothetical protein IJZ40_02285 [Bacteroidaceae bacterium]|nr:hypothetical protein [Bacteroidaceae bacterium]